MLNINIITHVTTLPTIETTRAYFGIHLFSPQTTTLDKIAILETVQRILQREDPQELSTKTKEDIFNTLVKNIVRHDDSYTQVIQNNSLRFLIDTCTNINTQRIDSIISFDLCNDKIYLFDWINDTYLDTQDLSVPGIDKIINILQYDTNGIY